MALGIAGAGRVITAAALLMVIVFAALSSGQVAFMRMIGVGLALAVVVDATLVRSGVGAGSDEACRQVELVGSAPARQAPRDARARGLRTAVFTRRSE